MMKLLRNSKLSLRIFSVSCCLWLASCSSSPTDNEPLRSDYRPVKEIVKLEPESEQVSDAIIVEQEIDYLSLFEPDSLEYEAVYQLKAAQQLNQQAQFNRGLSMINSIDWSQLPTPLLFDYGMTKAQLHSAFNQYLEASQALEKIKIFQQQRQLQLNTEQLSQWYWQQAQTLQVLGNYSQAAYIYFLRNELLISQLISKRSTPKTSSETDSMVLEFLTFNQAANAELLWMNLNRIDIQTFNKLLKAAHQRETNNINQNFIGWLELTRINLENKGGIEYQLQRYEQWQLAYPNHSASLNPPSTIAALYHFVRHAPKKVALMLPYSGRLSIAGEAIRDGFLATYYSLLEQGFNVPDVSFFDTADLSDIDGKDIQVLYERAKSEGVDMIIGPLQKQQVTFLQRILFSDSKPIAVLGLNSIQSEHQHSHQMVEFSLAVEQEIEQIAEKMIQNEYRRVITLGSDNSWGKRAIQAFEQRWIEGQDSLGYWQRTIVGSDFLTNSKNYVSQLGNLLNIHQSNDRHKRLANLLGSQLEFTARRRQDVDAIFLAMSPTEARQIKPLLAFYFADDIPVYATSSVYSGVTNSEQDSDMNQINFLIMPWLLDSDDSIKSTLTKLDAIAPEQMKFYAMGVDAFHLHQRLTQLQGLSETIYHGAVGTLSIQKQKVVKDFPWAKFISGEPRLIADGL